MSRDSTAQRREILLNPAREAWLEEDYENMMDTARLGMHIYRLNDNHLVKSLFARVGLRSCEFGPSLHDQNAKSPPEYHPVVHTIHMTQMGMLNRKVT